MRGIGAAEGSRCARSGWRHGRAWWPVDALTKCAPAAADRRPGTISSTVGQATTDRAMMVMQPTVLKAVPCRPPSAVSSRRAAAATTAPCASARAGSAGSTRSRWPRTRCRNCARPRAPGRLRRHVQHRPRQRQALGLGRRAQQPVVTDALEARRQHMLQQPGDELAPGDGDRALAAASSARTRKPHSCRRRWPQALVADGRAVRVARQVVQHRRRPGQRRLGIDHPVVAPQRLQRAARAMPLGQRRIARQRAGCSACLQRLQELAPEDLGQGVHREQEARARLGGRQAAPPGSTCKAPQAISACTCR